MTASAHALEEMNAYALAAGMYGSVIATIHALWTRREKADDAALSRAYHRLAYCLWRLGRVDAARDACEMAAAFAHRVRDLRWRLHVQLLLVDLDAAQGRYELAIRKLDRVAVRARHAGDTETVALAACVRGSIAAVRGDHRQSIRYFYTALVGHTNGKDRNRTLVELARAFSALDDRIAAQDAALVLLDCATGLREAYAALIILLVLAVADRNATDFEKYRRAIEKLAVPPPLAAEAHVVIGDGYRQLGLS